MTLPGNNTLIIAQREYLARVRSKGFWLATVALPLALAAFGVLPSLLLMRSDATHRLVIVDVTGRLGDEVRRELTGGEAREVVDAVTPAGGDGARADFEIELLGEFDRGDLNRRVLAGDIDAWILIDDASLEEDQIRYYAESVSNFFTQERIENAVSAAVRAWRLEAAGYDADEVGALARPLDLAAVKVTPEGEKEEGVAAGIVLAYFLFFTLYLVLVIYGQQVMNGVIEEKSICSVALTQLGIWMATVIVLTLPGVVAAIAWIPQGTTLPTLGPGLALHLLINFLLGFFLFCSLYAAIGAAFNSVQEAQHFAVVVVAFLVLPVLLFWKVLNDPDGGISVVTSMIPLFTPLLMMLRLVVKAPPAWQVAVAYLLTAAFTWALVWFSSRVYRVGILMYGKRPSLSELARWIKHG
jgi:ABC-2 type transport system permease protein